MNKNNQKFDQNEKLKDVLVYVGAYSPTFLLVLEHFKTNQKIELIFVEAAGRKSTGLSALLSNHLLLSDYNGRLEDCLNPLVKQYNKLYCLSVAYEISEKVNLCSATFENVQPLVSTNACIEILNSKKVMSEVAQSVGLPLLESFYFSENPAEMDYPAVIRPVDERAGNFKAAIVNSSAELKTYMGQNLVAQRFVKGPNLVVHVAKKGEQFSLEFFWAKYKFEGVTLLLEKATATDYQYLAPHLEAFLDKIGFEGIGHFEFIVDHQRPNELYFLDFNGRLGGTSLKVLGLGYDEFVTLLQLYGIDITMLEQQNHKFVSNILALLRYGYRSLKGYSDPLDYPQKSSVKHFVSSLKLMLLAKSEISLVSYSIMRSYLVSVVKGKLN